MTGHEKKWFRQRRQDIKYPLWTLLLVNIHSKSGQTSQELAKTMKVHYSSIHAYVFQFHELGLVMRVKQGHKVLLYTTTAGATVARMLYSIMVITGRGTIL